MKYKLLLLLVFLGAVSFAQNQRKLRTLSELQKIYIGKEVIVRARLIGNNGQYHWYEATKNGNYFVINHNYIPVKYLKQKAKIIALQLESRSREELVGKLNAFGEAINLDSIINPKIEIVVQFKDGTIALERSAGILIKESIVLVSEVELRRKEMDIIVSTIVGDTLYADKNSRIFKPTANLDEMLIHSASAKANEFPRLEPLIIEAAKSVSPENVIILKLKDSQNKVYLSFTEAKRNTYMDSYTGVEVVASGISMHTKIPEDYTLKEVEAIKRGSFIKGMSIYALYSSMGFPDETNENSYGGNQLIYGDRLLIYLDEENENVESWQYRD